MDAHILKISHKGYVNSKNQPAGFYRTKNKMYIEDWYANKAKKL